MKDSPQPFSESLKSLLSLASTSNFWVEWTVLSDFGPGWIGGERKICFYLDQTPFADTPFHDWLKETLIKVLRIPQESPEAVINGEGEIHLNEGSLELEFSWDKAIPYQYPTDGGNGKVVFIDLKFLDLRSIK